MAKKFAGFTNDQALVLLNKVGFTGQSMQADEVKAFLASSPSAVAKLGQYADAAQKRLDMLTTPTTGFAEGGTVDNAALNAAQKKLADAQNTLGSLQQEYAATDPTNAAAVAAVKAKIDAQTAKIAAANAAVSNAQSSFLLQKHHLHLKLQLWHCLPQDS
jgi:hypothetical protein